MGKRGKDSGKIPHPPPPFCCSAQARRQNDRLLWDFLHGIVRFANEVKFESSDYPMTIYN